MKRENNKIGQGIFETVAAARPARPAPARPSVQKKKKKKKKNSNCNANVKINTKDRVINDSLSQ